MTVVLDDETLVITLHEALSPAERALARTPEGADQVQEFHRRLFASATGLMREEIHRITGRQVREEAAEIETATGTVVHAFTTGAMVQVYLMTPDGGHDASQAATTGTDHVGSITNEFDIDAVEQAEEDGLRTPRPT